MHRNAFSLPCFSPLTIKDQELLNTYCMEFSIRVMVRKAARLAVYEEMTIKANIHQTPIIILVANVVYGTSPPTQKRKEGTQVKKKNAQ